MPARNAVTFSGNASPVSSRSFSTCEPSITRLKDAPSTSRHCRGSTEATPEEYRYSPGKIISSSVEVIKGRPDSGHISTSYVERQNLTVRMSMRRFRRLTNAFSKKVENNIHAVALHFMHYNFCNLHKTLRVTPAMEAGIATHVWGIKEIIDLLDRPADLLRRERRRRTRLPSIT
jgi:hypothetical protein